MADRSEMTTYLQVSRNRPFPDGPVGIVARHDWPMSETSVAISLTSDEALVLFDLLHRWEDQDRVSAPQAKAEKIALSNLSALLERQLVAPFDSRYNMLVAQAAARLAGEE